MLKIKRLACAFLFGPLIKNIQQNYFPSNCFGDSCPGFGIFASELLFEQKSRSLFLTNPTQEESCSCSLIFFVGIFSPHLRPPEIGLFLSIEI